MAKLGLMLMPPKGRVSVIHADDLARLLLALAEPTRAVELPDRARRRQARRLDPPRVREGARRGASAPRPAVISSPGILLRLAAHADQLLRGEKAKLTDRPRRLLLPPQLGRRTQARRSGRAVAAGDRDGARAEGDGGLVSRKGLAVVLVGVGARSALSFYAAPAHLTSSIRGPPVTISRSKQLGFEDENLGWETSVHVASGTRTAKAAMARILPRKL